MTHPVLLGFQVPGIVFVWFDTEGNILFDRQSIALQAGPFYRIICDEFKLSQSQFNQYIGADPEIPLIL